MSFADVAASASERELVRTPLDKTRNMPKDSLRRSSGAAPKPPALWASRRVLGMDNPEPCYGRYPKGFLAWALADASLVGRRFLHVCSGGMSAAESLGGIRVDLRPEAKPDVLADGRALPFADESVDGVLIDPPYSVEYAEVLYGIEYPRPSHLLAEASRVVRPGGRIGFLHYLVPFPPPRTSLARVVGVTQGLGYRIRAWSLFVKEQDGLFPREETT